MPANSDLYELFRGILDDKTSSESEDDTVAKSMPSKRPKYKIGPNWEAESSRAQSNPEQSSSEIVDMVGKRDYQDMPPDAIDAAGAPKKRVKIINLDKYEAVEGIGEDRNDGATTMTYQPEVTKPEDEHPHECGESMDIDRKGDPQQEGGKLTNSNAQTHNGQNSVQPIGCGRYLSEAPDIGRTEPLSPISSIAQVPPSSLDPKDTKRKDKEMDTVEEDVQIDDTDSRHRILHESGNATVPKSKSDPINQSGLNCKEDRDIIDLIEEAVEPGSSDSIQPQDQSQDTKTRSPIPKASPRQILPSQHEKNVNSDFEDEIQHNQQANVCRPKYKSSLPVRQGYVLWWSNLLGKGQISERHTNEVRTINWWQLKPHYGSLHSGISVEYQWEYGRFQKFWVTEGMPYVLYAEAVNDLEEYPYMRAEYGGRG